MQTDNFNRADGPAGWTTPANSPGSLQIAGNRCTGEPSLDSFGWLPGETPTDAQRASAVHPDAANADSGLCVRLQDGGANGPKCYFWQQWHGGTGDIYKLLDGFTTFSVLDSRGTFPWADGDRGEIRIDGGGTIKCFKNGVQQGADVVDGGTLITGGRYGLFNYGNVSTLEDFEGEYLGGSSSWGGSLSHQWNRIVRV